MAKADMYKKVGKAVGGAAGTVVAKAKNSIRKGKVFGTIVKNETKNDIKMVGKAAKAVGKAAKNIGGKVARKAAYGAGYAGAATKAALKTKKGKVAAGAIAAGAVAGGVAAYKAKKAKQKNG